MLMSLVTRGRGIFFLMALAGHWQVPPPAFCLCGSWLQCNHSIQSLSVLYNSFWFLQSDLVLKDVWYCYCDQGRRVKNPQRAIPIVIVVSLAVCFLAYFGVSAALTLICLYLLDEKSSLRWLLNMWAGACEICCCAGSLCALSTR